MSTCPPLHMLWIGSGNRPVGVMVLLKDLRVVFDVKSWRLCIDYSVFAILCFGYGGWSMITTDLPVLLVIPSGQRRP